jgi:hypothetical protein
MHIKILTGNPEQWVEFEASAYLFVNTCKRCQGKFDTPQKERIYCGDKCQFATWNDNRTLKNIGTPTVKTSHGS